MKRHFPIILILFAIIGCKSPNQIKEIEILSYFTSAKEYQTYSSINRDGFAKTLSTSKTSKNYVDCYESKISEKLLDSIIETCRNASSEKFIFKNSKAIWFCGMKHSIRITYENGNELVFCYPFANEENKQFKPFQSLFNQIYNDSLKSKRLNHSEKSTLYLRQEKLSNSIFKKDSIYNLSFQKKV